MALLKRKKGSRPLWRLVNDYQQSVQSGDYRSAKEAVEKALAIEPMNERLKDMEDAVLELMHISKTSKRKEVATKTTLASQPQKNDFDAIKAVVDSYRDAWMELDADALASLWDESSGSSVYITARDNEVYKGYYEIKNHLRAVASTFEHINYEVIDQVIDQSGDLAWVFCKIHVESKSRSSADTNPTINRLTLVLKKSNKGWYIVHGHNSTLM